MMKKEDLELFELIYFATNGDVKAKWKIIWKFNNLIVKNSKIKGKFDEECQEYLENKVFNSIEKFKTLKNIKNK